MLKFFKSLLHRDIRLRVAWTRLQAGRLKLGEPFADRALSHVDRKAARHFLSQVKAASADDFVDLEVGAREHQLAQFLHLRLGQLGGTPGD